ncbi:hypothetical protein H310_07930 [Aphanomyces invadans]|uniref:Cyclic nucleotide-binding domain-containing protein n=1 Tax=Aphanomyces invadans TaxID=157072 RepID=A0A024U138_9STRA|nr:hypothetical protein H310_07930 [Aphanomyces invadans]ETV99899.1 hypothetical protein H310_07930 [Aphanomyces invadans]|eukprot:XP_008871675.1 hypothetical protein H310_07930 [Aphanomyces invadans]
MTMERSETVEEHVDRPIAAPRDRMQSTIAPSSALLQSTSITQLKAPSTKLLLTPADSTPSLSRPTGPTLLISRMRQSFHTDAHHSPGDWNVPPVDTAPLATTPLTSSTSRLRKVSSTTLALAHSASGVIVPTVSRAMTKVRGFGRKLSHDFDASQILEALAHMNSTHKAKLVESKRAFVVSMHSPWKLYWDFMQAAIAAYAIVLAPLDLAFHVCDNHPVLAVIQVIVDSLFVLDSVLLFNTTYIDANSLEEVFDRRLVTRHYLIGAFRTDWFTSVPLSYFGHVPRYFGCLRFGVIFRARRLAATPLLHRMVHSITLHINRGFLRLVSLAIGYILVHHYIACAYILVTIHEGSSPNLWTTSINSTSPAMIQYLDAYFGSIMVTTGESMNPKTTLEIFFSGFLLVVGVVIQACTVGLCAGVFAQIYHVEDERVQRAEAIHAKLKNCHIEPTVQSRILEYYDSPKGEDDAYNAAELLKDLPAPMRLHLQWSLHVSFLRKVPFFQTLEPEGLLTLLQCMEESVALSGDMIIRAGEVGQAFYLIQTGSVAVFHKGSNKRILLKSLGPGDFFGEMSLISEPGADGRAARTTANVEATSFCTFQVLYKDLFLLLTEQNDQLKTFLIQAREQRLLDSKRGKQVAIEEQEKIALRALNNMQRTVATATLVRNAIRAMKRLVAQRRRRVTVLLRRITLSGPPSPADKSYSQSKSSGKSAAYSTLRRSNTTSHNTTGRRRSSETTRRIQAANMLLAIKGRRLVSAGAMDSINSMSHVTTKRLAEARRVAALHSFADVKPLQKHPS